MEPASSVAEAFVTASDLWKKVRESAEEELGKAGFKTQYLDWMRLPNLEQFTDSSSWDGVGEKSREGDQAKMRSIWNSIRETPWMIAYAGYLGRTRLIDNVQHYPDEGCIGVEIISGS
jgi:pantothenate synthetase